ncbi:MAG: type II toxin-antitoxin system RelE/ParE family toxin [Armatimonadota bacterium]
MDAARPWTGLAAPRYNKRRKRLSPGVLQALNPVQAHVLQDPHRGDRKRGALRDVWLEKFQAENDQYLLAYSINAKRRTVIFLDIGQHENFYRDLGKYLKSSERD